VVELLTVEGRILELPQSRFILANSDNFEPQSNMLTYSTARLFWNSYATCSFIAVRPNTSVRTMVRSLPLKSRSRSMGQGSSRMN